VTLIDADRQGPPEVILEMSNEWRKGYDKEFKQDPIRHQLAVILDSIG
jgi:hypothetical protein